MVTRERAAMSMTMNSIADRMTQTPVVPVPVAQEVSQAAGQT